MYSCVSEFALPSLINLSNCAAAAAYLRSLNSLTAAAWPAGAGFAAGFSGVAFTGTQFDGSALGAAGVDSVFAGSGVICSVFVGSAVVAASVLEGSFVAAVDSLLGCSIDLSVAAGGVEFSPLTGDQAESRIPATSNRLPRLCLVISNSRICVAHTILWVAYCIELLRGVGLLDGQQ